jgi:hypothetical protein
VNVCCDLIGPYVPELGLIAANYLHFLTKELPLLMKGMPLKTRLRMFFQHDGVPPHFGHQVKTYLNQRYENLWIGHAGSVP